MSSYLSPRLFFLLTAAPALMPAEISTGQAVDKGAKRLTRPAV